MSPRGEVQPIIERQPLWWLTAAGVTALGGIGFVATYESNMDRNHSLNFERQ